jgi:hypothetical protein
MLLNDAGSIMRRLPVDQVSRYFATTSPFQASPLPGLLEGIAMPSCKFGRSVSYLSFDLECRLSVRRSTSVEFGSR